MTKKRRLNVKQTEALMKATGLHCVGDGLYLQVTSETARSWICRYQLASKRRDMGLGSCEFVTLAEATDAAYEARRLARMGTDPIGAREGLRAAVRLKEAKGITFKETAEQYIKAHAPTWKNAKHQDQWRATLETYAYPVIGSIPVAAVDTTLVTKILQPIWLTKNETARRVRMRMENILDAAKVNGSREGDNPARWRGHLDHILPKNTKRRVKHMAALPFKEIGTFMQALKERAAISARALEFTILTAARTEQTIGAEWNEIDFAEKLWTIPPERMKGDKEHRVPLSQAALDVLRKMEKAKDGVFIFPGGSRRRAGAEKAGKPLSENAMLNLLQDRMGHEDLTVHGFRSTFKDWASECTTYPGEVSEMALAHTVEDAVEAAYRRGDLLEKRRALMTDWARYCSRPAASHDVKKVVSIRAK